MHLILRQILRYNIPIGGMVSVNNAFRKRVSDDIIIAIAAVDQTYYTNTVIHVLIHKHIQTYIL